jgi:hypothetical protein
MGVADEAGEGALTAFGIFSGVAVSFGFSAPVLAVFFFFGVGPFRVVDFFFADLDFAVGLGDFFGLGAADFSGVSFGLGVASSVSDVFFFAAGVSPSDSLGLGEVLGSGVSLGFGFGVGDVLLLGFFGFGETIREDSAPRVCRNCSRLRSSSSVVCARRKVPIVALSAKKIVSQIRKRATAAERNRRGVVFKRPAKQEWPEAGFSVLAPGARLRLIFRPAIRANKSNTSR